MVDLEVTVHIDVFCAIIVATDQARPETVHAQDPGEPS